SLKSSGVQTQPTVSTAATESVPAKKVPAKAPQETQPSAQAVPEQKKQEKQEKPAGPAITAPLNGTFYLSQAAGKPPFIQIGDTVEAGTTVCIVEAMKLFNEIKTTSKCKILDILSKHGEKVEKDQELIRIEKLS
ncbi:MAG: biotin/lipoyl-containing protein, partial [bacterium]